ncbi:hypothetical protein RKE30_13025 [Streptomyces sp. Li-HN-5-11]|uniref:hypothetical protein n=1 Tax=Streptomyces sp. Li-HN-5-11 TaxID=3075432 RepID=UPI0028AD99F0|nr:hypothetical protein [Streptomyces sp. Li-HN-5-11]WNM31262.1 hypothetical protein RKE30_13025 [Streptomyces sp. Li-HN-5-11]
MPDVLDTSAYDTVCRIPLSEAQAEARRLARTEGILAGVSSGAALHAATTIARYPQYYGALIVVVLPGNGERYLSTDLFT